MRLGVMVVKCTGSRRAHVNCLTKANKALHAAKKGPSWWPQPGAGFRVPLRAWWPLWKVRQLPSRKGVSLSHLLADAQRIVGGLASSALGRLRPRKRPAEVEHTASASLKPLSS